MRMLWIILAVGCGNSATAPQDAAAPLPAVDSNACELREGCNLCDDGMWHCGTDVFPACAADFDAGGSCQPALDGSMAACVACGSEGGTGDIWQCAELDAAPYWEAVSVPCQP